MQPLTQIQSTLNSYTDLNPPSGNVYYQIEVVSPHPCYPDSVYSKAKTNYNTSRSNRINTSAAPNLGFVQSSDNNLSMMIMPNPNKGMFVLEIKNMNNISGNYHLEIFNSMGSRIYGEDLKGTAKLRKTLNLNNIGKGVYIIRLTSDNNTITGRFVVQ